MGDGGLEASVELPEGSWWDWEVVAWDGGEFRLGAGHDLSYSHGLELVFTDPLYVSCPSAFHDPVFRAPSVEEAGRVAALVGCEVPALVVFEADSGGVEPVTCFVAAESFEIVEERVLRYWRADVDPDQRFASWVQRPPLSGG